MPILRIEHPAPDFDAWKREGFDTDPIGREKGGGGLSRRAARAVGPRPGSLRLDGEPAGANPRGRGDQGVLTSGVAVSNPRRPDGAICQRSCPATKALRHPARVVVRH